MSICSRITAFFCPVSSASSRANNSSTRNSRNNRVRLGNETDTRVRTAVQNARTNLRNTVISGGEASIDAASRFSELTAQSYVATNYPSAASIVNPSIHYTAEGSASASKDLFRKSVNRVLPE